MPNEPQWLPIAVIIEINRAAVAITGEPHFLRDSGLLEGTLARPQNAFGYGEEDLVVLAVRLLAGIAQSHAFEQGNKRTAFIAMVQFLIVNGFDTAFDDAVSWADEIIALIEHRSTEDDFCSRPAALCRAAEVSPRPPPSRLKGLPAVEFLGPCHAAGANIALYSFGDDVLDFPSLKGGRNGRRSKISGSIS